MSTPAAGEGAGQIRVSLRSTSASRRKILFGTPSRCVADSAAFFLPGELLAYLVELPRAEALFVFRTGAPANSASTTEIDGVEPAINLLAVGTTKTEIARLRNLLLWLPKQGRDPGALSDDFWLRVAGLVAGRRRRRAGQQLRAILAQEAG